MCRHLAYLGTAVSLASVLYDAPHSLEHQSYAPADMRAGGTVNVDGYGVGWFPGPVRYRRAGTLWSDPNLRQLAATESTAFLAAVRSATVGMPVSDAACAPFTDGTWLFSHNGRVDGWPGTVAGLAKTLDVTDLLTMDAPTDSALLWTVLRRRLEAGKDPAEALVELVREVADAAPKSRLNFLLTNGKVLTGTTWTHTLWVLQEEQGVTIASERLDDDPGWREIPDRHVVTADPSTVEVRPI
ncbi:glutamine amidotransferase class-II [Lentzea aerocolonigenes]|uniref:Gamma-glutamyl-hercynylcysteine sulfoxide hydrolase n=1 Tax=Lentzea aerocolonigenes TaxID=68170 RepID=A0A0F0GEF0_LENAE|nr:ergothioneine biosynthesis protein EgtC [Lentzea aerocolonigenes]KJK41934.1 glutamine amidotransferase class-II [Lentzea aerocolonigenes]